MTDDGGLHPSIEVGDRYSYTFTLDHDATDVNASTSFGSFPGALVTAELVPDPANVGSWDPTGGTFPGGMLQGTFDDYVGRDLFRQDLIAGPASGFPLAQGQPLAMMEVTLSDGTELALTDSGLGETLGTVLGGAFDPDRFPGKGVVLQFGVSAPTVSVVSMTGPAAAPAMGAGAQLVLLVAIGTTEAWVLARQRRTAPR